MPAVTAFRPSDDSLSQYGCSGGTVACSVVRFRGNFFHHLRTHILNLSSSSISRATETPSLVMVGAPKDLSRNVTAFGPRGNFHCICASTFTPRSIFTRASLPNFTSLAAIIFIRLNSYVQCRARITLQQLPECRFGHDQHFFIVDLLGFHTVAIVENNDVANFTSSGFTSPFSRIRPLPTASTSPRVDFSRFEARSQNFSADFSFSTSRHDHAIMQWTNIH